MCLPNYFEETEIPSKISSDQAQEIRILDFVTGMAFMSNSTIRSINRDGVFLILPSNSSLSSSERERLQDLGLYKINV